MERDSHANNFDILRAIFAYLVVISHSRFLYGSNAEYLPFNLALASVQGFFVISGFLMALSLERQPGLRSYSIKRFFRIYPLYVIAITLQTIIFSLHAAPGSANLFSNAAKYYIANLLFLNFLKPSIGDILDGLRVNAINGALWTLKIEVAFYCLAPFLLRLYKRTGAWILALCFAGSCLYTISLPSAKWTQQLPGQLRFFVIGILLFYYGRMLDQYKLGAFLGGVAGLTLTYVAVTFKWPVASVIAEVFDPIFLGLCVYAVAFAPYVWSVRYDFSYSAYIVHFPLIQLALLHHLYLGTFWFFLPFTVAATTALAWLSFRFVEKPSMDAGRALAAKTSPTHAATPVALRQPC